MACLAATTTTLLKVFPPKNSNFLKEVLLPFGFKSCFKASNYLLERQMRLGGSLDISFTYEIQSNFMFSGSKNVILF